MVMDRLHEVSNPPCTKSLSGKEKKTGARPRTSPRSQLLVISRLLISALKVSTGQKPMPSSP